MASPAKKCSCRQCKFSMRARSHNVQTELRHAGRAHRRSVKLDLLAGREPAKTYSLPRVG